MPYATNADLTTALRNSLPNHAQDIYRKAYNNAVEEYGTPDIARKVGWAAVKKSYKKGRAGTWVKIKE